MSRTTKGTSIFSGALGLFQSRPRKISRAAASRNGTRALSKKQGKGRSGPNPYQSAEIEFDPQCACDAVKRIAGRRFLVRDVPTIPVPDCDVTGCKCTYIRFKDRRLWVEDRRAHYSLATDLYRKGDKQDRRRRKDRRVSEESVARGATAQDDFESWFK